MVPLAYIIRSHVKVSSDPSDRQDQQLFSQSYGSIEDEMIDRTPHGDALDKEDNCTVYHMIEEVLRGTDYYFLSNHISGPRTHGVLGCP